MDPYNNLNDFITLCFPNTKLSDYQKKMIDAMHTHSYSIKSTDCIPLCTVSPVSLGTTATECPPAAKGWGCKKKEENPMASYASAQIIADTGEKDQRRHVQSRLYEIYYTKKAELKKKFGLLDDEAPMTPAAFVQRIADGKYTIDKEKMDKNTYSPAGFIRWRDPAVLEDKAGYDAAREKLSTAYTAAQDKSVLAPATDLLATLEAFEAWQLS